MVVYSLLEGFDLGLEKKITVEIKKIVISSPSRPGI
jgi:hypothetical protein